MNRRSFLKRAAATFVALKAGSAFSQTTQATDDDAPYFRTSNQRWQSTYDAALRVLAGNVRMLPRYDKPVLIEGSSYNGIWMECGPTEALVYRKFRPDVARNSHLTFFKLQLADGQFPSANKATEAGYGQIQMVVPIAATAWELARATRDDELLRTAYASCCAWDNWLMKYRNTRGTGLVEGFCTYDTGNDNSPRFAGIPNRCPDKDAKKYPPGLGLPRLCPDLSATTYGSRIALSAMARALGKSGEADQWAEKADKIRGLILSKLYVPEVAAFFDLDSQNQYIRIRSEIITRICGEHVPDQTLFEQLWTKQIHNSHAFWPAFPLPSVAVDDPKFVRPIPRNSWGGASQALTALRAGRWFDHYGKSAEFAEMMDQWCEAIQRDPTFRQQIDPLTGEFTQTDEPNYSPCALVMMDYTWRLAGIVEEPDTLHWNVRPNHAASKEASFRMKTDSEKTLEMRYDQSGASLSISGKQIARIEGGAARLITDPSTGLAFAVLGIVQDPQQVLLQIPSQKNRQFTLKPNQRIEL